LAHGFRDFNPWLVGFIAFGSVTRQHIILENMWKNKAAHFMTTGDKKER
jgi:hypothetical protein